MFKITIIVTIFVLLFNFAGLSVQQSDKQQANYDEIWKRGSGKTPALSVDETFDKLRSLLEPPFGDAEMQHRIKYLVDVHEPTETRCNNDDLTELYRVQTYNELEFYRNLNRYIRDCRRRQLNLCLHDLDSKVKSLSLNDNLNNLELAKIKYWVETTKSWGNERGLFSLIKKIEPNLKNSGVVLREKTFERRAIKKFESLVMEMCNRIKLNFGPLLESYNDLVEKGLTQYLERQTLIWLQGASLCKEIENDKQHYIDGFLQILKKKMTFIV